MQTTKSDVRGDRAPVLVLALGNPLLTDDGVGQRILASLSEELADEPRVELLDGGTQGLALLGILEHRQAILLLDAVRHGAEPGTPHFVRDPCRVAASRGFGAHGGNATELLAAARLLGLLPELVRLVGVEPLSEETSIGLSRAVERALPAAHALARRTLLELLAAAEPDTRTEARLCTS